LRRRGLRHHLRAEKRLSKVGSNQHPRHIAGELCPTLERAAAENGLPLDFFVRVIWQESRFNALAVSPKGAQGIAQFMPQTADWRGLSNPFDASAALKASASYLRDLRTRLGNLGLENESNIASQNNSDCCEKESVGSEEVKGSKHLIRTILTARGWNSEIKRLRALCHNSPQPFQDHLRTLHARRHGAMLKLIPNVSCQRQNVVESGSADAADAIPSC
jgi:hypothetical protein